MEDENTNLKKRIKELEDAILKTGKTPRDYEYISIKLENIHLNQIIQELKEIRDEGQSHSSESLD